MPTYKLANNTFFQQTVQEPTHFPGAFGNTVYTIRYINNMMTSIFANDGSQKAMAPNQPVCDLVSSSFKNSKVGSHNAAVLALICAMHQGMQKAQEKVEQKNITEIDFEFDGNIDQKMFDDVVALARP